ncbi:LacI family DNA-binding transcriptional regulator, partial [Vallitalea guaymasensis]
MPTIKDVAKLAGVSISTVSYALNGTRSISEETKKKVYAAVKELDYKPSGIARSLKMKRNQMIAVVVNEFIGPIYQEIMHGVSKAAKKYG